MTFEVKLFESYYGDSRYGPVKSIDIPTDRFLDLQVSRNRPALLCERIVDDAHRLYFDLDSKIMVEMAEEIGALRDGLTEEEVAVYDQICADIRHRLTREGVPQDKQRVVGCYKPERIMLNVHPKTKVETKWKKKSLRFYCPDIIASKNMNRDVAAELNSTTQTFIDASGWKDLFPQSNMDLSIYSENAPMLILGSCKHPQRDPIRLRRSPDPTSMAAAETDFLINIIHEPHQYVLLDTAGLSDGPVTKKRRVAAPKLADYGLDDAVTAAVTKVVEDVLGKSGVVRKVAKDAEAIWVTLDEWFCPQKQAAHASNRQYAFINSSGLAFKCHDEACTGSYNNRPLAQLPLPIRQFFSPTDGEGGSEDHPSNSLFKILNEKVQCDANRQWDIAPKTMFKNTNHKHMWIQPEHNDCFAHEGEQHDLNGCCGIVTDTENCLVGVKCPQHGLIQRPNFKAVLEHVHVGLLHVQVKGEVTTVRQKDTELASLIADMFEIAQEKGMRISLEDTSMYAPVEGKPTVFRPHLPFGEWIREALMDDPRLLADPCRFDKLEHSLRVACHSGVPLLKRDRDIVAFKNGILTLSSNRFTSYEELSQDIDHRVCRHYIDFDLNLDDLQTSALDAILDYQFATATDEDGTAYDCEEIKDWILALIGRLFFPVGDQDMFEVTPVIFGASGTGKSSIGDMVNAFFPAMEVGSIGKTFEMKFGLEGLYDKDVIISLETPQNLHLLLDKTLFQSMSTGEMVSVARKSKIAVNKKWTAPMIFFANQMLSFFDAGGLSVARRVVSIQFERALQPDQQDTQLKRRLLRDELPAALYKCVEAYNRLMVKRTNLSHNFWAICPPYFKHQLDQTVESTNPFLAWLKQSPNVNGIEQSQDAYVLWDDVLKPHIERRCPSTILPRKLSTKCPELSLLSWRVARKTICLTCASIGGDKCCGQNKAKRTIIFGCRIFGFPKPDTPDTPDTSDTMSRAA